MVSLLCGCCAEKPITSLNVTRVFRCFFEINPMTYRWYRKNENKQTQLMARLNASRYDFSLKDDVDLFKTLFYMANYHDYYWEQANAPLHMFFPDPDNEDDFRYALGADFLTPFGNDTMVELPSASDMSSYLVPELLFDNPTSDFFIFLLLAFLILVSVKVSLIFMTPIVMALQVLFSLFPVFLVFLIVMVLPLILLFVSPFILLFLIFVVLVLFMIFRIFSLYLSRVFYLLIKNFMMMLWLANIINLVFLFLNF